MNRKRIISICAILGIVLGVAVFAAQNISDIAKSTISASNLDIEVVMEEESGGTVKPVSGETTIVPGAEISRIATVKNTGKEDAWVRVKADFIINGDSSSAADSDYIELLGLNDSDWKWKDGYWYYTKPLASGAVSEALFTGIKILPDELDDSFDETNLKVDAEGTQVKNNGSTVFEAAGWTEI